MVHLTKLEKGLHSQAYVYLSFALRTFVVGFFGFLAFVIKFTILMFNLERYADDMGGWWQWVLFVSFLNQTFGIVQIWKVENERLFLFLFGGEDSLMQAGEVDRQEVFLASVPWNICTRFFCDDPPRKRMFKRIIALLGFSHYDIQSLVLDEDEDKEIDASVIKEVRATHRESLCAEQALRAKISTGSRSTGSYIATTSRSAPPCPTSPRFAQ